MSCRYPIHIYIYMIYDRGWIVITCKEVWVLSSPSFMGIIEPKQDLICLFYFMPYSTVCCIWNIVYHYIYIYVYSMFFWYLTIILNIMDVLEQDSCPGLRWPFTLVCSCSSLNAGQFRSIPSWRRCVRVFSLLVGLIPTKGIHLSCLCSQLW